MGERRRIRVLFFASAREAVGKGAILATFTPGDELAYLLLCLSRMYPRLNPLSRYGVAVDGELIGQERSTLKLREQKEIAILPPYSGG